MLTTVPGACARVVTHSTGSWKEIRPQVGSDYTGYDLLCLEERTLCW